MSEYPDVEIDREDIIKVILTLEFYAKAETYGAIGFIHDDPCGALMEDFSDTKLGDKPGRRARAMIILLAEKYLDKGLI